MSVSAIKVLVLMTVYFCTMKPVPACMVYMKVLLQRIQFVNIFFLHLVHVMLTLSKVNNPPSPSYFVTSTACDHIIFSDSTDPTEHLGYMIHASVSLTCCLSTELQVKLFHAAS